MYSNAYSEYSVLFVFEGLDIILTRLDLDISYNKIMHTALHPTIMRKIERHSQKSKMEFDSLNFE